MSCLVLQNIGVSYVRVDVHVCVCVCVFAEQSCARFSCSSCFSDGGLDMRLQYAHLAIDV